jgi:uncharacterized integral membrane protein
VSDASHQTPQKLVFVASTAELAAARKLAAVRLNRKLKDLTYWGVIFLLVLVVGLVVYAAYELDLFDFWSLKPVLITAYAAFIGGGFAHAMAGQWRHRRLTRAFYEGEDKTEWEISLDDTAMIWRSEMVESRISWHAISAVEDTGSMLLLWRDIPSRTTFIPTRVFESAQARAAFVAAVAAHIAAAHSGS